MGFVVVSGLFAGSRKVASVSGACVSNLLVGLYAVYFFMIAYKGDSMKVMGLVQQDAPKFLPWVIVIVILSALYNNEKTHAVVKPFIILAVIAFVLKNFGVLSSEVSKIYYSASGTTKPKVNQQVNQSVAAK